jgi:uncharacterized protein (TIGR02147 family)
MQITRRITRESTKKPARIALYRYNDYRLFLKDMIEHLRQTTYRFSLRQLANQAGFSTPNIFQMVLNGQRKLNNDGINRVADLFKLSNKEREFFRNLVNLGQAKSHEEKDHFYRQLTHSQRYSVLNKDEKYLYKFYSRWYFPVIRELVSTTDFIPDPAWIAERITPPISSAEATRAIRILEQCNQIRRTERGYEQITPVVTTGEEVTSVAVTNFHKTMIRKAAEALDKTPHTQRNVSSLTFASSNETYSAIVKEIYTMQQRIIAMLKNERKPEEVFQLNFQLFPCTQQSDKDRQ